MVEMMLLINGHNVGSVVMMYKNCIGLHVVNFLVNLSSDCEDKLKIYRDNFEKAYLDATQSFYRTKAPEYLDANGVQNYMRYADQKLKEEEQRASRYLETRRDSKSVEVVGAFYVHLCFASLQKCTCLAVHDKLFLTLFFSLVFFLNIFTCNTSCSLFSYAQTCSLTICVLQFHIVSYIFQSS